MNNDYYYQNRLTKQLDLCLQHARSRRGSFAPWMVIPGISGSGKSSSVKSWIEQNELKSVYIDAVFLNVHPMKATYYPCLESNDFSVKLVADSKQMEELLTPKENEVNVIFGQNTIDEIDQNTLVVIDNYDKTSKKVRDELLQYIRFHHIVDVRNETKDHIVVRNPLMLVVIIDTSNLVTSHPLTDEELKLFGLDDYIGKSI